MVLSCLGSALARPLGPEAVAVRESRWLGDVLMRQAWLLLFLFFRGVCAFAVPLPIRHLCFASGGLPRKARGQPVLGGSRVEVCGSAKGTFSRAKHRCRLVVSRCRPAHSMRLEGQKQGPPGGPIFWPAEQAFFKRNASFACAGAFLFFGGGRLQRVAASEHKSGHQFGDLLAKGMSAGHLRCFVGVLIPCRPW
jgi:hypothetical protein